MARRRDAAAGRRRLATAVGSTAAAAVAFTAFGAGPAWADVRPEPSPGPPVDAPATTPPAPEDARYTGEAREGVAPPVGDERRLSGAASVAPLEERRSAEFFAAAQDSLPEEVLERLAELEGVEAVEVVDAARVEIDGYVASVLGVDPSTFRSYAPGPSAESDEIWEGIAEGGLALSHDLGQDSELEVDTEVTVAGGNSETVKRVWAHATSGITGIDVLTSRDSAREFGFPEGNAVIISAPEADLYELREELEDLLGEDVGLQLLAEAPEERSSSTTGDALGAATLEAMIGHAEDQLGTPYVWGGEQPGGFDCSGLVQWAFAQTGVSVPRVAADQWGAGARIDYQDAERGDLLFWRSDPTAPQRISHVAIYLGDDMMLEAPRRGTVVRITDVRFSNMAGVVRVLA
jgi:cell wall-associated NlpC family hydrolase